jgi:hypothetical protein
MATIANIAAEARALVSADSTSYPDATLLRRLNHANEEVVGKLIALNKNIKFDDHNQTDLPFGTFNLTAGTSKYAYSSVLLAIDRVEIKDADGNWHRLKKISEDKIDEALSEYQSENGLPSEYSRRANSIFLYPAPAAASCTLTAGGKIYYQRTSVDFANLTGTTTPGFSSPYHYLLSYKAALPYALSFKKDRVPFLREEIMRMEREMFALESNKDGDRLSRIIPKVENNR